MKKLVPHLLFILCSLQGMARVASDVQSHNMLSVLGKDKNSPEFKTWKTVMSLDKQYANPAKGVKLVVNEVNGRVESIILAGKNYETGQTRFQSFSSVLPFGISWNDDTAKLIKKLGATEKLLGKNSLKFNRENTGVEIAFASFKSWDIQYVRYFHEMPRVPLEKRMTVVKEELKRKSSEDEARKPIVPTAAVSVPAPEIKMAKMESSYSEFKRGILSVFESYKESAFAKMKGNIRPTGNFWNYKYTYTTGLKIPGEKYNMLYSFPFDYSQLDFVSVLKEADEVDGNFVKTYKDFEKKLMENFPAKEGWKASCVPNRESKALSDLEFRNDSYGVIVLDYCRSPKGKHVLYMRFLLFSD